VIQKPTQAVPETLRFHTRMDAVQSPIIPVIGRMIRETPGTISLGQGVVHYGPPPEAVAAAREAVGRAETHEYGDGAGRASLVARIGRKLQEENGVDVADGRRVMVTAGANMAFIHAVLAVTEPGDEVLLPAPFYFNHEMAIQMAGCRAVPVPTDGRYQLQPDAVRRAVTDRTRAVVTISPNNPSGAVFTRSALGEVNAVCAERGLYHLADEVYEYFTYGEAAHTSVAALPGAAPHTIAMYSLSKAYGFAGWRIGYVVYPEHLATAMMKSQDTILICPTILAQVAAEAALDVGREYCRPFVRDLEALRGIVVDRLSALAPLVEPPTSDGALYCLLKVNTPLDPLHVAERLIREHGVAVIPGTAFGMADGCYFRVAYGALQAHTVEEGLGRLVHGLRAVCS
jgi:aspartate/methionine/tyrosine aminotransferase